ncbi:hypothetical protein FKM82_017103 [Ascaphus truei]
MKRLLLALQLSLLLCLAQTDTAAHPSSKQCRYGNRREKLNAGENQPGRFHEGQWHRMTTRGCP